jgi:hypothetical protein
LYTTLKAAVHGEREVPTRDFPRAKIIEILHRFTPIASKWK